MARLARAEVFDPSEVAVLHLCARVVRRCFLFGVDPVTGKNHDHRKIWIEEQLKLLSANFGIDLLAFAILSNHFHLILRSRPDVVETWDDSEVARRWLMLCPKRKKPDKSPEEPNEFELNSIRNEPDKLATIRKRLSDVAWWMRLLCQNFGTRANQEDKEVGKFSQGRYRAVRILDEETLLACANQTRERCSDKGFLSMPIADYLELLDASARQIRADKIGYTPADVAPVFERLKLDPDYWRLQIKDFGRLFSNVAGKPKDVYAMRSLISKRRFYLKRLKPEAVQTK